MEKTQAPDNNKIKKKEIKRFEEISYFFSAFLIRIRQKAKII
jgi:hypothetical protein